MKRRDFDMKVFITGLMIAVGFMACNDYKGQNMVHEHYNSNENMQEQTDTGVSLHYLLSDPSEIVVSSQIPIKVNSTFAGTEAVFPGIITADESRSLQVSARISGRIEKLFVTYSYEYVRKGQKIMEIYSPELNTIQEEYLLLLEKGNADLVQKTEEKLKLLGLGKELITKLRNNRQVVHSVTIYSPYTGYVIFPSAVSEATVRKEVSQTGNMEMGIMSLPASGQERQENKSRIREGAYVQAGQTLFSVNDLKKVWGIVSFPASFQGLTKGKKLAVVAEQMSDTIQAEIDLIEPEFQTGQKFTQVRLTIPNENGSVKINSFISVIARGEERKGVWIPEESMLDIGKRKIVWVLVNKKAKNNAVYQAQEITVGAEREGMVEVLSGLTVNDSIAPGAGFLTDSESIIKP